MCAKAGDLILWDSRTIHCNTPAIVEQQFENYEKNQHDDIIRLVSYVCMVPFEHASSKVIETRKEGFRLKAPTSHWPTKKVGVHVQCDLQPFEIEKCSREMLQLVGYRDDRLSCTIY